MTLKFWKYLITNCNGSAICFVAEQDRECTEKELECDPRLLGYIAQPQFEMPGIPLSHRSSLTAASANTARPTKNGGESIARLRCNHQQHALASVPKRKWHIG
jgi:hypothetical protein